MILLQYFRQNLQEFPERPGDIGRDQSEARVFPIAFLGFAGSAETCHLGIHHCRERLVLGLIIGPGLIDFASARR